MSIVSTIETDTTLIIRVSLVSKISTTNAATPGCVSVYFAMYNFMRRSKTSEDQDKWTKTLSDVDLKDIPPIFTVETSLPWFQLGPIQPLLLQQPILVPSLVWRQWHMFSSLSMKPLPDSSRLGCECGNGVLKSTSRLSTQPPPSPSESLAQPTRQHTFQIASYPQRTA